MKDLIVMALLALSLAGCNFTGPYLTKSSMTGQVLEVNTDRPIGGVALLGLYRHDQTLLFDSRESCHHMEFTVSDADGRYTFPIRRGRTPAVYAYKKGYQRTLGQRLVEKASEDRYFVRRYRVGPEGRDLVEEYDEPKDYRTETDAWYESGALGEMRLRPFVPKSRQEQFDYYHQLITAPLCAEAPSKEAKVPFYRAILPDVRAWAESPAEKKLVEHFSSLAKEEPR